MGIPLDISLLQGLSFQCRPDCGLCCYATPAVTPAERQTLVRIAPATPFLPGAGGYALVACRPQGGACHFLKDNRCRCYGARPFPCIEYPITVHVGSRAQASVCLSCPGVIFDGLDRATQSRGVSDPRGLEEELAHVRTEFEKAPIAGWIANHRRRENALIRTMEREGRWEDPEHLRQRLLDAPPFPDPDDFPVTLPPSEEEGVENLPLFFEEGIGVVALAGREEGYDALLLQESGGVRSRLGTFSPPDKRPELDGNGHRLLEGYLRLVIRRDQLIWAAYAELRNVPEATLGELAEEIVREAASQVLSRAVVRARLKGMTGDRLTREDVARGVRATDSDLLDLPTLGRVL